MILPRRPFRASRQGWLLLTLLALMLTQPAVHGQSVRIKDITDVEGARANQIYGFGLVTGLQGTGSRSLFTQQVAADMLQRLGTTAKIFTQRPDDPVIRSTSVSAVMVTAEIGPYNRVGSRIDVTVSALDDASSLQGGTLLYTPLRGPDGETYAIGQGPLSIGGFILQGQAANVQKNHANVGRIANGGIVEREALGEVLCKGYSRLLLKNPDFQTSRLIARAINQRYPECAKPMDAGAVLISVPPQFCKNPIEFLSEVGLLEVRVDTTARVVINERTGTVVVGNDVKLAATAIAHGNLTVTIAETPEVSQPAPFSGGVTTVVPRTQIDVNEGGSQLNVVPTSVTVGELARGLNSLGVSPRDLISIFQALQKSGALHAELVVI